MIKSIVNISRAKFISLQYSHSSGQKCFISIHGTEDYDNCPPTINGEKWIDGIVVHFDDTEPPNSLSTSFDKPLKLFSEVEAIKIIDFVKKIHSSDQELDLIIHCLMGISRSAAVGKFFNDVLKLNLHNYNRLQLYNSFVYSQLVKVWF